MTETLARRAGRRLAATRPTLARLARDPKVIAPKALLNILLAEDPGANCIPGNMGSVLVQFTDHSRLLVFPDLQAEELPPQAQSDAEAEQRFDWGDKPKDQGVH